jgi:hypothetical protein
MTTPTPFESLLPIPLQGSLKDINVFEGLPTNASQIISTSENWGVQVAWEMNGAAANFFLLLPEKWHVRLHLESIGPTGEFDLPIGGPLVVNYSAGVPAGPNVRRFENINLNIPAGTVPAGVYNMALTVQLADPPPTSTLRPVVGFIEGMMINFYD